MEKQATYKTLKNRSEGIYKEKGSKFIGIVAQCYSEEEAKKLLDNWNREHHQARHLCYAYRFGVEKLKYRANDDGEPNNSAGAPILGQIDSFDLTNVLIGVVRYYGGTKLGVGGLINAYRSAAKDAIENGTIITLTVYNWISVNFDYFDMPKIMELIKRKDIIIEKKEFLESCTLLLKLDINNSEEILKTLKEFHSTKITDKGIY